MKVVTVLGTRPEIIRLSLIIGKLDRICTHKLIHTGQNYVTALSDIFFEQLGVRRPDLFLDISGSTFATQVGQIMQGVESALADEVPDAVLILGDTDSGLASVVAMRMGIDVYHMEAGNRCYDSRVPEEVNRRIIDHSSTVLLPYTNRSRENLLREGIPSRRITVTGNPIFEVMKHYQHEIVASTCLERLGLEKGQYFLVTIHRAENVDVPERLSKLVDSLELVAKTYDLPVICSTHPRTRDRLNDYQLLKADLQVQYLPPMGFFDFVNLEKNAKCVLTDSGTVQEECCINHVPVVTLRDVTERPETVDCGSNVLSGVEPERVVKCLRTVLSKGTKWNPPEEYLAPDVSSTIAKIIRAVQP